MAPYRIGGRVTRRQLLGSKVYEEGVAGPEGTPPPPPPGSFEAYLERLMRLIPAEILGLYLVGDGIIPTDKTITPPAIDSLRAYSLTGWTVFCLIGVILIRAWGTADRRLGEKTQWVPVIVASISFLIWVYSIGGAFREFHVQIPFVGSLLVLAWTFLVPFFYVGPSDPPPRSPG